MENKIKKIYDSKNCKFNVGRQQGFYYGGEINCYCFIDGKIVAVFKGQKCIREEK